MIVKIFLFSLHSRAHLLMLRVKVLSVLSSQFPITAESPMMFFSLHFRLLSYSSKLLQYWCDFPWHIFVSSSSPVSTVFRLSTTSVCCLSVFQSSRNPSCSWCRQDLIYIYIYMMKCWTVTSTNWYWCIRVDLSAYLHCNMIFSNIMNLDLLD